jgi:hypothetical protein
LQQLGHRFYWPELGRFIQQDPIGDGMNWYGYVGNNPVVGIDPEGLWAKGKHGELADYATSAIPCMTQGERNIIHEMAEEPDEPADAAIRAGRWPHFGDDKSEEWLDYAVYWWNQGNRESALRMLGWALHNLADHEVHPRFPLMHFWPGFSEDPKKRKKEWAEAQRRSRDLLRRFWERTQQRR